MTSLQPEVQDFETHTIVEQYATQVLDFSSQYGAENSFSYAAANCLGVPTKFPKYGDFSSTFCARQYGPWWDSRYKYDLDKYRLFPEHSTGYDHFIDLKFEHSVFLYTVYVYETFNPGAIVAIYSGDCKGKWTKLWDGATQKVGHKPRVFQPPMDNLNDYPINQLRLIFNQRHLSYYTEIDAVAMLGTLEPSTTEAKLVSAIDDSKPRGPILKAILKRKLYRCLTETLTSFYDVMQLDLVEIGQQCLQERQRHDNDLISASSHDGQFGQLPREIILYIFKFLDFQSLVVCSQVSSLFRNISWDASLYHKVQLRHLFDKVNNDTLKFLYNRADALAHLDISWCGNYGRLSPAVLNSFLSLKCDNLSVLNVSNCHIFTVECLRSVSKFCKNLEHLNLANCHMLDQFFTVPSLKSLDLYRTQIRTPDLKAIVEHCKGLESLKIGSCGNINADTICSALAKSASSRTLSLLDLWRSKSLTARGVFSLTHLTRLRDLDLGWCTGVDANSGCLVALVNSCNLLEKLFLAAHRQLSDRDVNAIRVNLSPNLKKLNIMGTRNVSTGSVVNLATDASSLKLLDIGYCEQLEDTSFLSQLRHILPRCHIVSSFNLE